ncbi:hypothetical protein [Pseudomonas mosselii]|uniref:hypothetical protein n=1 Tax=Pseudomonas mosselii TaxID=78327 RepID=UPI001F32C238|nr:hypothetical protein [Pseudomonas mosselii]
MFNQKPKGHPIAPRRLKVVQHFTYVLGKTVRHLMRFTAYRVDIDNHPAIVRIEPRAVPLVVQTSKAASMQARPRLKRIDIIQSLDHGKERGILFSHHHGVKLISSKNRESHLMPEPAVTRAELPRSQTPPPD